MGQLIKLNVIILLLLLTLSSCTNTPLRHGRALYKKYFSENLKDPQSFKVYKETYILLHNGVVVFVIDYGANNSYGAMTRERNMIATCMSDDCILVNWEKVYPNGELTFVSNLSNINVENKKDMLKVDGLIMLDSIYNDYQSKVN